MSRPKNNKSVRIIKTMRQLRNLENTIEEINQLEESETEIAIKSTKRKYSVIQKQKRIKINELQEDFRILTVKRRMKGKPESFKMKNKKKVIALEKEIKTEIINNAEKSKLEILREILKKNSR